VLGYELLTGARVGKTEVAGLRVGVLTAMPRLAPDAAESERDDRAQEFARALEDLGMRAEEVALPVPTADLWPVFYGEAAATHRHTFPARRDEYGPVVRAKLDDAQRSDPRAFRAGLKALAEWRAEASTEPAVDLIVSPTLGVSEIPQADVDELEIRVAFSAYTRVFSFLGWPAIAIGGVQLAAREVDMVIGVARARERAFGPPAAGS
jgi:Asp-tRNA(Asn)/Glu-tRNA(Gln) amidotransferase A subunit family amidase